MNSKANKSTKKCDKQIDQPCNGDELRNLTKDSNADTGVVKTYVDAETPTKTCEIRTCLTGYEPAENGTKCKSTNGKSCLEQIKDKKGQNVFDNARTVIRVYDITGQDFNGTNANSFFDVPVVLDARSWYLQVPSGRTYICDIGAILPSGEFILLTRSNKTTVPTGQISNVIDEKWMMVEGEYEKILKMFNELWII